MLLYEMIHLFLDSRKRGVTGARKKASPRTLETYDIALSRFTNFLLELERPVTDYRNLNRLHIVQFLDLLDSKVSTQQRSQSYRLQTLRVLRIFFRWVDKDEDCQLHELKGLQRFLPVLEADPVRLDIPDNAFLKKFKNEINTSKIYSFRDYVAVSIMADNGARLGELCNAKVTDLYLEQKMMRLCGKSGERIVPLSNELIRVLKAWLKRRKECRFAADSEYLFMSQYGPRMRQSAWSQKFMIHYRRIGGPRITAHTFRHAFCTNYLTKGGQVHNMMEISGHSSYVMAKRYVHKTKARRKQLTQELEKISLLKEI